MCFWSLSEHQQSTPFQIFLHWQSRKYSSIINIAKTVKSAGHAHYCSETLTAWLTKTSYIIHSDSLVVVSLRSCGTPPWWVAADAGIKIPSVVNPELSKVLSFKVWRRSEFSLTCFAYLATARNLACLISTFPLLSTFFFFLPKVSSKIKCKVWWTLSDSYSSW